MSLGRPTSQTAGAAPVTEEARLVGLLRQAESYAYALAHGYDIGGQTDRAYGFVALAERLCDTASEISALAVPIEPHSDVPILGLRSRAFALRRLLRGSGWNGQSMAPLVPRLDDPLQICTSHQLETPIASARCRRTIERRRSSPRNRLPILAT
jgi:hypothetical protein